MPRKIICLVSLCAFWGCKYAQNAFAVCHEPRENSTPQAPSWWEGDLQSLPPLQNPNPLSALRTSVCGMGAFAHHGAVFPRFSDQEPPQPYRLVSYEKLYSVRRILFLSVNRLVFSVNFRLKSVKILKNINYD